MAKETTKQAAFRTTAKEEQMIRFIQKNSPDKRRSQVLRRGLYDLYDAIKANRSGRDAAL
ncbi:MAG: hypothetical protein PHI85_09310 [Victivallaceae bacterium]|nr:hypothetical protein [Victivallaceae bacterium]